MTHASAPARPPETLFTLLDRLGLRHDTAYDPLWSAAPDFLECIADHVLDSKPKWIVECSSGVTTVVLARCCELNGIGHVWSLENGPEFAEKTRAEIARHALASYASVLHAPLKPHHIGDRSFQWYDLGDLDIRAIDMLVIDGPPGFIQPLARYPALPCLQDRLTSDCTVFMDDAARPDEQAVVSMWLAEQPGFEHQFRETERGCSILRRIRA